MRPRIPARLLLVGVLAPALAIPVAMPGRFGSAPLDGAQAATGTFTQVDAGDYTTCGVRDGRQPGLLGEKRPRAGNAPRRHLHQVDVSIWHACGVKTDDTLACWGYNYYGQASPPTGILHQGQRRHSARLWSEDGRQPGLLGGQLLRRGDAPRRHLHPRSARAAGTPVG